MKDLHCLVHFSLKAMELIFHITMLLNEQCDRLILFLLLRASLNYNLHTMKVTNFKYTI